MAINLLQSMFNKPAVPATTGLFGAPKSSPTTVGMSTPTGPQQVPIAMGTTAKYPAQTIKKPAVTLPATQQNPVVTNTAPVQPPPVAPATPTQTFPVTPTQTPPATPTFGGLLGQAAGQAGAINTTAGQIGQYGQMTPEELQARQKLGQMAGLTNEASILATESSPETLLQQGRANLAQQAGQAQTQSLSGVVNALAAERAANTGAYTGQANAQTQAGGLLTTAAGQAAPQLGAIGQVPFSPTDLSQGTILGSTQPGGLQAAGNLLGQFQGAQAAGSALGGVQATQTAQQEAYKSAHQQAQNLQSQVGDLITKFGLNPSDINVANLGVQKIAQNVSDPRYQILSNYLADIASRYSQILTPAGGSATDTTRAVATGMLNGIASGNSILQVMNALDNQAQAVISGVPTTGGGTQNASTGPNPWH